MTAEALKICSRVAAIKPVLGSLLVLVAMALGLPGSAKVPGSVYCFKGVCHRVKTLAQTEQLVGKTLILTASHYGHCRRDRHNPCGLTSSGEAFHANAPDNAASPDLPDGTILLLFYRATGNAAVVRVNNAGPYWGNRRLDVSNATARKLGFARRGVAELEARVLRAPQEREAHYRRHRRYRAVPGFIGTYASLEAAYASLVLMASFGDGAKEQGTKIKRTIRRALEAMPIQQLETSPRLIPDAEPSAIEQGNVGAVETRSLVAALLPAPRTGASGLALNVPIKAEDHPEQLLERRPSSLASLHDIAGKQNLPLPPSEQAMDKKAATTLQNRTPRDYADLSFDGYATAYTLKASTNDAPVIVAWNADDSIFGRFANWASDVQTKARTQLASTSQQDLTPHQQALSVQSAAALGGTFEKLASAVGEMMEYAAFTARAHAREAAGIRPDREEKSFRTSSLSPDLAKGY